MSPIQCELVIYKRGGGKRERVYSVIKYRAISNMMLGVDTYKHSDGYWFPECGAIVKL